MQAVVYPPQTKTTHVIKQYELEPRAQGLGQGYNYHVMYMYCSIFRVLYNDSIWDSKTCLNLESLISVLFCKSGEAD